MDRETCLQEWLPEAIEQRVCRSRFDILAIRTFTRLGGQYPLMSVVAQATGS
jgi:hypothetical protein